MGTSDPSFAGWVSLGGQDRKGVPGKGNSKLLFIQGGDSWLNSEGWVRISRQDRKKQSRKRKQSKSWKFLSSSDKLMKGRGHVLLNFITLTLAQSLAEGRVCGMNGCWVNDGWMQGAGILLFSLQNSTLYPKWGLGIYVLFQAPLNLWHETFIRHYDQE